MLISFFYALKDAGIQVSTKEFLTLLEALQRQCIDESIDDFYFIGRTILIKNEAHFDKYDQVFAAQIKGILSFFEQQQEIPLDWLLKRFAKDFTEEQKLAIQKYGYENLMRRLGELLNEQKERHEGGNKWIGTGGSSPFGHGGFNPEGIRIGGEGKQRKAVKVWEARAFRDYDDAKELGTRNIKIALRRLRKFARQGAAEELALDATIHATANNAGFLDLRMQATRKNNIKILMLLDVGGSMDDHIAQTEELFSAAKAEFKHMDFYYFHNCVYDYLWKNNQRRHNEKFATWDILRKYSPDTKLIFVGDASMSPYEILQPGGSIEYNNDEAGSVWIQRLRGTFKQAIWLNPAPEQVWPYRHSISVMRDLMEQKMFSLTLSGLEQAMRFLSR